MTFYFRFYEVLCRIVEMEASGQRILKKNPFFIDLVNEAKGLMKKAKLQISSVQDSGEIMLASPTKVKQGEMYFLVFCENDDGEGDPIET